jgi:hypothetical protein
MRVGDLKGHSRDAMSAGVDLPIPADYAQRPLFTKFKSLIPDRQGFMPDGDFYEEITTSPAFHVDLGSGAAVPLHADHGLILCLAGKRRGIVGTYESQYFRDEDEIDTYEEQFPSRRVSRFYAYDFYITRVVATNGPELRAKLHRLPEEQQADAMTRMLSQLEGAFSAIGANTKLQTGSQPQDIMDVLQKMSKEDLSALLASKEVQSVDEDPEVAALRKAAAEESLSADMEAANLAAQQADDEERLRAAIAEEEAVTA